MATSVDLGSVQDRADEHKIMQEILNAPPWALADLTDRHNQVLPEVFGTETVAELGCKKHFALAGVLVALATKLWSRSVSVSYPGAPSA